MGGGGEAAFERRHQIEQEFCLFKSRGRLSVVRYSLALLLGSLHRRHDIEIVLATRIGIKGHRGDPVHGDGDIIGRLPLQIGMDPMGIEIIAPAAAAPG